MKKTMSALLCAVLLLIPLMAAGPLAESAEAPADVPQAEDFAGEYTCSTLGFGDNVVPLDEKEPYRLSIAGDEAVVNGIEQLGTDPLKLSFENGELYWIPDGEEVRVFTLRRLEDGLVTMTFDQIPEAPVFRFEPVKAEE